MFPHKTLTTNNYHGGPDMKANLPIALKQNTWRFLDCLSYRPCTDSYNPSALALVLSPVLLI